jgi:hypothetical protein
MTVISWLIWVSGDDQTMLISQYMIHNILKQQLWKSVLDQMNLTEYFSMSRVGHLFVTHCPEVVHDVPADIVDL